MSKLNLSRTTVIDSKNKVSETVKLAGWVANKRDHGKVTFIDLRDETGLIQCVGINDKLKDLTIESVVEVIGQINKRPAKLVNQEMATGEIEVFVEDYQILNKSIELPISINSSGLEINEELRLQYRYLDLRRQRLQKNLRLRSKLINSFRQELIDQDFVEIETPMLTKSTKEGARDFIVPSRFYPGKFYALPQSPQQYKQLLMAAGFEKYFQFARCIRDEDLRADRGFEFTQLDIELSFIDQPTIMQLLENLVKKVCQQLNVQIKDQQFPVVTYQEAMEKYGADRFDLRTAEDKERGVLAFAWVVNFPFFKKVSTYNNKKCNFSYRNSIFRNNNDLAILSVKLNFQKGNIEAISLKMKEYVQKRVEKQPKGGDGSVGSFFKNPIVNNSEIFGKFEREKKMFWKDERIPAGWLIEEAGFKGKKFGNISVSDVNANFLINNGGGTMEEVLIVAGIIKQKVRDKFGVELQEEVKVVYY